MSLNNLNTAAFSGAMDVKMAPKALSHKEESELQAMLDRLALEQEEEVEEEEAS